jgi:hypothetical protein
MTLTSLAIALVLLVLVVIPQLRAASAPLSRLPTRKRKRKSR